MLRKINSVFNHTISAMRFKLVKVKIKSKYTNRHLYFVQCEVASKKLRGFVAKFQTITYIPIIFIQNYARNKVNVTLDTTFLN